MVIEKETLVYRERVRDYSVMSSMQLQEELVKYDKGIPVLDIKSVHTLEGDYADSGRCWLEWQDLVPGGNYKDSFRFKELEICGGVYCGGMCIGGGMWHVGGSEENSRLYFCRLFLKIAILFL